MSVPAWLTELHADHIRVAAGVEALLPQVRRATQAIIAAFEGGGFVYTFGNGGSAADAQHLAGELIGHYKRDRRPLPCITIGTDAAAMTCIANDYSYDDVFARQVAALVRQGDVVCAFTTSGRSPNVLSAMRAARRNGATVVLFGGSGGGPALAYADIALVAPSSKTARVQEMHTLMLHMVSEEIDAWAAGTEPQA